MNKSISMNKSLTKSSIAFSKSPKNQQYLNIARPVFNREELANLKNLFKLYDHEKKGFVKPKDLVEGLKHYEINKSCPQLYDIVCGLSNLSNNSDGISFQDLVDELQEKFGEEMDRKEVRRIFDLFLKDKEQDSIYLADIRNTCADINLDYGNHELIMMLKDASALKNEMTFDEFYVMMTTKLIHIN